MHIEPKRVRTLRENKGWSPEALAGRTSKLKGEDGRSLAISAKTIRRLECSDNHKPRANTLCSLARALGVESGVLTGELPMPSERKQEGSKPSVQISALIRSRYRLAYALIKRRYGVPASALIEMAPLLFTLLAEDSLRQRREHLTRIRAAIAELRGQHDAAGRLAYALGAYRAEDIADGEEASIEAGDVFGRMVPEASYEAESNFDATNPFADYLKDLADKLEVAEKVRVDEGTAYADAPDGFPEYVVCGADLDLIVASSDRARFGLEQGHVHLADVPDELLNHEATAERIRWIEERVPESEWSRWTSMIASFDLDLTLDSGAAQ
ncbi:helix-turn-helix transcriptional regulator [Martelella sp. HB161492]|uniref:helix-turn-helix domain-containing protein n=1 Tax=Martelella sp. HB161492 TaxID=2720726 RepID=UPI001591B9F4|nr:helix-turn-helix transcriptional regulator [Martelella sp. HB161492]